MRLAVVGKMTLLFWVLGLWCVLTAHAAAPLPPAQAFKLSVKFKDKQTATANWQIAPGYNLYQKRLQFQSAGHVLRVDLPETNKKYRGLAVYQSRLVVPMYLNGATKQHIKISYQGCAEDGFCYPGVTKEYILDKTTREVKAYTPVNLSELLTSQNKIQNLLVSSSLFIVLSIFFVLGLLLALTPCVLPMVPILTGIIVGHHGHVTNKKAFALSAAYVFGMAITYAFAGVMAAAFGSSLQVWLQQPVFIALGAMVLVLLALSLLDVYQLRFSRHWQNLVTNWSNYHQGGNYLGVFFMGVLSTLIVSPCVTAPLVGVLMFIAQSGDTVVGGLALFLMGLGMGVPLLIVGCSAGQWLPKAGAWMDVIKACFGLMMLAMALWLLARVLPALWMLSLSVALLFYVCYWVAVKFPRMLGATYVLRGLAVLLLLGFGVYSYQSWNAKNFVTVGTHHGFATVHSLKELEAKVASAKQQRRPVLVDFYADWCESCIVMEKQVLSKPAVTALLKDFELLRVDLSNNTPDDIAIMQHFRVIAPPTILLFNANGEEISSRRIVGEMNETEFVSRLNMFFVQGCDLKRFC